MIVLEFRKFGSADEYYAGLISRVANDGFKFESEAPDLNFGDILELKLKKPGQDLSVIAAGNVVRFEKNKYGFIADVTLHQLSDDDQMLLDEILSPSIAVSEVGSHAEPVSVENTHCTPVESPGLIMAEHEHDSLTCEAEDDQHMISSETVQVNTARLLYRIILSFALVVACAVTVYYISTERKVQISTEEKHSLEGVSNVEITSRPDNDAISAVEDSNSVITDDGGLANMSETYQKLPTDRLEELDAEPMNVSDSSGSDEVVEYTPANDVEPQMLTAGSLMVSEQEPIMEALPVQVSPEIDSSEVVSLENQGINSEDAPMGQSRYVIHVSAWQTHAYATSVNKRVKMNYPSAFMVFENGYYIVMIPNISSREESESISKDLRIMLDVQPIVYLQKRDIPVIQ